MPPEHAESLKKTALHESHVVLGGRMVPFAGWEMPIQYESILAESRAVRSASGLFDVSHMGRVEIRGPGAAAYLDRVLSFNVSGLRTGRARYGVVCNEDGGIIDDCITYRLDEQRFLLIPNASNTPLVLDWLSRWARPEDEIDIDNATSRTAMIAHQGPEAAEIMAGETEIDLSKLRPFRAVETEVCGIDALLARTGYTGEDGFEIILDADDAAEVWRLLLARGAVPCGLGARDVLRLEAGLLLHGNDMDTSTNPEEAGLGRFVDPDRDGYVAGEALRRIRRDGPSRALVGFNMVGRGVPRHGHPIVDGAEVIGAVSSGGYSPTLDKNIGLGYVPTSHSAHGSRFHVDIRGRQVEAQVTPLPFYSRKRGR